DVTHWLAVQPLLPSTWREHTCISVMNVDYPFANETPHSGPQIHSAYEVVMAVQDLILPSANLSAQSPNELGFSANRNGLVHHNRVQSTHLLLHRSRLLERAVKCPVGLCTGLTRVLKHAHQPPLNRTTIEIFDNVENSCRVFTQNSSSDRRSAVGGRSAAM